MGNLTVVEVGGGVETGEGILALFALQDCDILLMVLGVEVADERDTEFAFSLFFACDC